jgi:hypothetical protein
LHLELKLRAPAVLRARPAPRSTISAESAGPGTMAGGAVKLTSATAPRVVLSVLRAARSQALAAAPLALGLAAGADAGWASAPPAATAAQAKARVARRERMAAV